MLSPPCLKTNRGLVDQVGRGISNQIGRMGAT